MKKKSFHFTVTQFTGPLCLVLLEKDFPFEHELEIELENDFSLPFCRLSHQSPSVGPSLLVSNKDEKGL